MLEFIQGFVDILRWFQRRLVRNGCHRHLCAAVLLTGQSAGAEEISGQGKR